VRHSQAAESAEAVETEIVAVEQQLVLVEQQLVQLAERLFRSSEQDQEPLLAAQREKERLEAARERLYERLEEILSG